MKRIKFNIDINYSVSEIKPPLIWWQKISTVLLEYTLKAQSRINIQYLHKVHVGIELVGQEQITQLNLRTRKLKKPTDVLSYPVNREFKAHTKISALDLGQIVICVPVLEEQAMEYGHSLEREGAFLLVHGLLHLLGYDHQGEDAEQEMCRLQEQILSQAGLKRIK